VRSWETLSTLHYEWSVCVGKRRYIYTIWVCFSQFLIVQWLIAVQTHFGCRIAALLSFVFALVFLNSKRVAEHCRVRCTQHVYPLRLLTVFNRQLTSYTW
jgi:hypothetical protein